PPPFALPTCLALEGRPQPPLRTWVRPRAQHGVPGRYGPGHGRQAVRRGHHVLVARGDVADHAVRPGEGGVRYNRIRLPVGTERGGDVVTQEVAAGVGQPRLPDPT